MKDKELTPIEIKKIEMDIWEPPEPACPKCGDKVEFWRYKRGMTGKETATGKIIKHRDRLFIKSDDDGFTFPIQWVTKIIGNKK